MPTESVEDSLNVDGKVCQVSVNQAGNSLHGGEQGFSHRNWDWEVINDGEAPSVQFHLVSPDGDQGFPGTLSAKVVFTLTQDNHLRIEYAGQCDSTTVFNPTNHSYFNLAGHQSGPVKSHQLQVCADYFTPADAASLPTGELKAIAGSDFDLNTAKTIAACLMSQDTQILTTQGLDQNWCIRGYQHPQAQLNLAAVVTEPDSGRCMEVHSTMPGIQVYTANFLGDDVHGKEGAQYGPYHALCLEPQYYPDSPNHANFPSPILYAG